MKKQRDVRRGRANSVEVDLIRGGKPVTLAQPLLVPLDRHATYHVVVCRAARRYLLEYYACPIRSRLPVIRLPLRPDDADIDIDLQQLIDHVYEQGLYAEKLNYTQPLIPPLPEEDAQWARSLLREAGMLNADKPAPS